MFWVVMVLVTATALVPDILWKAVEGSWNSVTKFFKSIPEVSETFFGNALLFLLLLSPTNWHMHSHFLQIRHHSIPKIRPIRPSSSVEELHAKLGGGDQPMPDSGHHVKT